MKNIWRNFVLLSGIVSFLCTGCYDDKGSYTYHDVNEVYIKMPESVSVYLPKQETDSVLFEISPEFTQTLAEGEENLTYVWEKEISRGGILGWEVVGNERIFKAYLKRGDIQSYDMRLTVKDTRGDGSEWYAVTKVVPVVPYSWCWFVLQENEGKSVLGCVDGNTEERMITPDAYKEDKGVSLPLQGRPLQLLSDPLYMCPREITMDKNKPMIMVVTDKDALLMNGSSLENIWTLEQMLYVKTENGGGGFAPEFVYSNVYSVGEIFIDGGKLFYANGDTWSLYFPVRFADSSEDFEIQMGCPVYGRYILYDKLNHRLLQMPASYDDNDYYDNGLFRLGYNDIDPSKVYDRIRLIGENDYPNEFDPNTIGMNKKLLGMGYASDSMKMLVFFYDETDGNIHVCEIDSEGWDSSATTPVCSGEFVFPVPEGVAPEKLCFATTNNFDRIFFMGAGNKIYRVDLSRAQPKLASVYEHENAMTEITKLKFRYGWQYLFSEDGSTDGLGLCLGAALDYGGNEGGIVEMNLNQAGDLDRDNPGPFEYKGFGKIVDIAFSFNYSLN